MIHKVQGVSFPRSGHEIVWHAMRKYFQQPMCDYGSVLDRPEYIWARNHDFDGDLPKIPSLHYVIQYRNPVRSITSNYHLHARNTQKDSEAHWHNFMNRQIVAWKDFAQKWLIENGLEQVMMIPYERLVHRPHETLVALFRFMSDQPINEERVPSEGIRPRNSLEHFPYYDEQVFDYIEERLAPEMSALDIPSYTDESSV